MKDLAGKHLWTVRLSGSGFPGLFITTAKQDAAVAVRKAKAFMRRNPEYHGVDITLVEHEGTIDA